MPLLFPFDQYWWLYAALIGVVLALLALDLGVFHRTPHRVSFREAAAWCAVWVAIAVLFNIALYAYGLWRFPLGPPRPAPPGVGSPAAALQVALPFLSGHLCQDFL